MDLWSNFLKGNICKVKRFNKPEVDFFIYLVFFFVESFIAKLILLNYLNNLIIKTLIN